MTMLTTTRDAERDPRYPIGRFDVKVGVGADDVASAIADIAELPARLRHAVGLLRPTQLDTPYRSGGWTARQVVHHIADANVQAYIRFRLALTEENPAVNGYEQERWARLPDAFTSPVNVSLALLDALHVRWVALLTVLTPADFARTFRHPQWGNVNLATQTAFCAWHGRHHTAHVISIGV